MKWTPRQQSEHHGDLMKWTHGDLMKWTHGDLMKWTHGDLVKWTHGDLMKWTHGDLVKWTHGDHIKWTPWCPNSYQLNLRVFTYRSPVLKDLRNLKSLCHRTRSTPATCSKVI